ncbi:MAG: hypothetical protein AAB408_00750 [Patescibacteria group bacterium]
MRKRLKKKKGNGCALCKPWKHAKMRRWKPKDESKIKDFERISFAEYAL